MGKKFFTIFVTMILCVSLAACGQTSDNGPAPKNDDTSSVIENNPDVAGETSEDENITIITEGGYEHKIGDAVFYTDNDLNRWIDGDVFDFYGMMDYFGWIIYPNVQEEIAYWVVPSSDTGLGDGIVRLDDSGVTDRYDVVHGEVFGTHGFSIELVTSEGKILKTPNGRDIAYELCEILLYAMECMDKDQKYVTADMSNLAKYLPARIIIGTSD